jgi:predicted double-glycine peptidase
MNIPEALMRGVPALRRNMAAALALAATLGCASALAAATPAPDPDQLQPARVDTRIKSMRELRDAGVVRQHYDYSCGSAALASLLTYGLNDPVGEQTLLDALLQPMGPDELAAIGKKGLSLQDLQRLAQMRGHKAQGFRVQADQLARVSRPVIAFVKPGGFPHFVVLKGVRGDRAYIADPSLGNVRMPLYRFLDMWADGAGSGVIFAVERKDGVWPAHYALQVPATAGRPIEALAAQRLFEAGKPVAAMLPYR